MLAVTHTTSSVLPPPAAEYREILADTSSEFKVFQQIPRPLTVAEDRNGWLITKHGTRYILRKRMRKTDKYRTRQRTLLRACVRSRLCVISTPVCCILPRGSTCPSTDGRTVKSGHMKTWSSSDSEGDEDMTVNTGKSKPSAASTVNSQQQGADVYVRAPHPGRRWCRRTAWRPFVTFVRVFAALHAGTVHRFYARQFKATWQVIADQHSAHSYYMYGIPKVRLADTEQLRAAGRAWPPYTSPCGACDALGVLCSCFGSTWT